MNKEVTVNNQELILKEYLQNFKQNVDSFKEYQTFCYNKTLKTCSCAHLICSKRKYYNRFNDLNYWDPIPDYLVKKKYYKHYQIFNYSINEKSTEIIKLLERTNNQELTIIDYTSTFKTWEKLNLMGSLNEPEYFIKELIYHGYSSSTITKHVKILGKYIILLDPETRKKLFTWETLYYYNSVIHLMHSFIENIKKTGIPTVYEQSNGIEISMLNKVFNLAQSQKNTSISNHQKYILLLLILKVAALRSDYSKLKINNKKDFDFNYLDFENKKLIINSISKNKNYIEFDLPDSIITELNSFIIKANRKEGDFLFLNKNNLPFIDFSAFIRSTTSNYLKQLGVNKKIGSRIIRQTINKSNYSLNPLISKKNADSLGHSIQTGNNYYLKK